MILSTNSINTNLPTLNYVSNDNQGDVKVTQDPSSIYSVANSSRSIGEDVCKAGIKAAGAYLTAGTAGFLGVFGGFISGGVGLLVCPLLNNTPTVYPEAINPEHYYAMGTGVGLSDGTTHTTTVCTGYYNASNC